MPCFKGLAVSIHTPDGPLPEYSVQKTSRLSRISTYIPVPPAKIPPKSTTNKPEPSTFAISITLLTPSQDVPYSTPKATPENPHPRPRTVGALPGHGGERGKIVGAVTPYVPLTTSPNETIAAYIYFDGRGKEEVATLLRKGEETWVNSRWVSVPESEGGGLAEREFLFREVGLERWLNGLDLEGKDAAATIEKRRQKLEKRRRRRKDHNVGSDDEISIAKGGRRKSTLRYGDDGELQPVSGDEGSLSDSNSSDDDDPIPEAAGQIKVALFRVLASGEIKRGEYSPQFDAHDDDEDGERNGANGETKDIDHTTSFAKPKTLDPKTISTQTVTGIDPTDKPYAVFTFLYRGQRQLQKMGILQPAVPEKTPTATAKRRSIATDLPSLGPLKKEGTVGFSTFRDVDRNSSTRRKGKKQDVDDMDSDSDEDEDAANAMDDIDDRPSKKNPDLLSPEDAERTGQVAEGIRKMKLKRQHSAEPLNANGNVEARKTSKSGSPIEAATPQDMTDNAAGSDAVNKTTAEIKKEDNFGMVGSPMKRQRASMAEFDSDVKARLTSSSLAQTSNTISEMLGTAQSGDNSNTTDSKGSLQSAFSPQLSNSNSIGGGSGLQFGGSLLKKTEDDDEEL